MVSQTTSKKFHNIDIRIFDFRLNDKTLFLLPLQNKKNETCIYIYSIIGANSVVTFIILFNRYHQRV